MKKKIYIVISVVCFILNSHTIYSQSGEVKFLSSIYNDSSSARIIAAKGLSQSVIPISAALPAAMLLTGFIKKDSALIEKGIKASVGLALTTVITLGLKYQTDRQRPFVIYPSLFRAKLDASDPSFPSGHTSLAFATATSLSLSCKKWYIIVPAYIWACGAGYSRMQLGVHYPTDVLMGALLGTASSFFSYKLEKWMQPSNKILNTAFSQ